jgi:hypothetical protein
MHTHLQQERAKLQAEIMQLRETYADGQRQVALLEARKEHLQETLAQREPSQRDVGLTVESPGVLGTSVPLYVIGLGAQHVPHEPFNPQALTREDEAVLRAALRQAGYRVDEDRVPPYFVCVIRKGDVRIQHQGGSEQAAFLYAVKTLHASLPRQAKEEEVV